MFTQLADILFNGLQSISPILEFPFKNPKYLLGFSGGYIYIKAIHYVIEFLKADHPEGLLIFPYFDEIITSLSFYGGYQLYKLILCELR